MTLYPAAVNFTGTYHQLGEFVNSAVSRRRIIVPTTLDLKSTSIAGSKDSISVALGLVIYTEQVKAAVKPAAKGAAK